MRSFFIMFICYLTLGQLLVYERDTKLALKYGLKWFKRFWSESCKISGKLNYFNTLTAKITRRLRSFLGCQTTSCLAPTNVKKSNCHFMATFLKLRLRSINARKLNALKSGSLWSPLKFNVQMLIKKKTSWSDIN